MNPLRSSAALFCVLIAGCAVQSPKVTEMRGPDGQALKNVKCSSSSNACLVAATESCAESGGTYKVIASHSNAGGTFADWTVGPVTWYNLTYACGLSDGTLPEFPFRGQTYTPPAVIERSGSQQRQSTMTNCTVIGNSINCMNM